ncbi:MAG: CNNM domain-containing protein, partial [Thermoanaerobaculia bacterium]
MTLALWVLLGVYIGAALASAFFAGSETALTSVPDSAVFKLKQEGRPGALRLERLRAQLPKAIGTLLIGNTVANIAAGSIGTAIAIPLLGEKWGVLAATVVTTLLLLVVAEVTPKTLAARRPEQFALFVSRPVELLVGLLTPLTAGLSAVARNLLRPFGVDARQSTDVT